MSQNRLELEIVATDKTSAGVNSAKRQFLGVEEQARVVAQAASKAFGGAGFNVVAAQSWRKFINENLSSATAFYGSSSKAIKNLGGMWKGFNAELANAGAELKRVDGSARLTMSRLSNGITAFERQASLFGTRGVDNIRARAQALRDMANSDELAVRRINAAQERMERAERRRMANAPESSFVDRLNRFGSGLASAGGHGLMLSVPLALGAKHAIDVASQLESARIGFTSMSGSAARGEQHVVDLQEFAAKTPFEMLGLLQMSRYLQASGFKMTEVIPALQAVGNAVSMFGGDTEVMQRVMTQIGQIKLKGKAQWVDLKLIAEAGVPVVDMLAAKIQKPNETRDQAQARVFKEMEAGRFQSGPTLKYLFEEMERRYGGGMDKMAGTLSQRLSNLKDKADQAFGAIGIAIGPTATKFIAGAQSMLGSIRELAEGFKSLPAGLQDLTVTAGGLAIALPAAMLMIGNLVQFTSFGASGIQKLYQAVGRTGMGASLIGTLAASQGVLSAFALGLGSIATGAILAWSELGRFKDTAHSMGDGFGWKNGAASPNEIEAYFRKHLADGASRDRVKKFGTDFFAGDQDIAESQRQIDFSRENEYITADEHAKLNLQLDDNRKKYLGASVMASLPKIKVTMKGADGADDKEAKAAAKAAANKRSQEILEAERETARAERQLLDARRKDVLRNDDHGRLLTDDEYRQASTLTIDKINRDFDDQIRDATRSVHKGKIVYGKLDPQIAASYEKRRQLQTETELLNLGGNVGQRDEAFYRNKLDLQTKAAEQIRTQRLNLDQEIYQESRRIDDEGRQNYWRNREELAQRERDLSLQTLEAVQAQTLAAKLAVEDQKLAIEQDYANKAFGIQTERLNQERLLRINDLKGRAYLAGKSDDPEVLRQIAEIDRIYDLQTSRTGDAHASEEIRRARQTAIDKTKMQIEENRRVFDSFKDQAGSLLDQLFSKTRSFGDAAKGVMKAAFLTPLKDAASSQISTALMRMLGMDVRLEHQKIEGTGPLASIRRLFARLGVGAQPVFGKKSTGTIMDVQPHNNSVPVWIMNAGSGSAQSQAKQASGSNPLVQVLSGAAGASILANDPTVIMDNWGGLKGWGSSTSVDSVIKDDNGNVIGGGVTTQLKKAGFLGGFLPGPLGRALGVMGSLAGLARPSGIIMNATEGGGYANPTLPSNAGDIWIKDAAMKAGIDLKKPFSIGGGFGGKYGKALNGVMTTIGLSMLAAGWNAGNGVKGTAYRAGGAGMAAYGLAGKQLGVMGSAGVGLAVDGWQRGGWGGAMEMAGGGALIGAQFGGPMGAAIGGAIGFGVGAFKAMFFKSATEKAKEKIKSIYGLNVTDKGILNQVVKIAKESFGGSIDTALRSPQIREMLELYAMSTNQSFGAQAKVRAASLTQTGSGLVQNEIYENGRALAFAGVGTRTSADILPGNPGGAGYAPNYSGPTVIQANINLDGKATTSVMRGETVNVMQEQPRLVQNAVSKSQKGNYGRRETAATQMSPGLLLA